jgi:hypothetical protein
MNIKQDEGEGDGIEHEHEPERDGWRAEQEIKISKQGRWNQVGESGDSRCFGTRTADTGLDYVWKLHGGGGAV